MNLPSMLRYAVPVVLAAYVFTSGTAFPADDLVLYSGRSKSLVAPIVQQFQRDTGIRVTARYGNTAQLALAIQEEGERSPADIFWAQDAGALGALADAGGLVKLPDTVVNHVPEIFRNPDRSWVATSGRARVLAYSPQRVDEDELPDSVFELTDAKWKGRVGWAPPNGSFQTFVTAMIVEYGRDKTKQWLIDMKENEAKAYPKNTPIIQALAAGEIDCGLPNHYYLLRFKASDPNFPAAQTFFEPGHVGNMVNVAGAGVLKTSDKQDTALRFIEYLLSDKAQQYFTTRVHEYPVTDGVILNPDLVSFDELLEVAPPVNLEELADLKGTLALLAEVGLL